MVKFMVNHGHGFVNEGEIYEAKVLSKKLNGWTVETPDGGICPLIAKDITVLELSEEEANMPIDF